MNFIHANGFTAEVIRSKRRSIAIKVSEAKVYILVPELLDNATINTIVAKKTRWIKTKLILQQSVANLKPKAFIEGEHFLYLGQDYVLRIITGTRSTLIQQNNELIATVSNKSPDPARLINSLLLTWYKIQADLILKEKTHLYSKRIGVSPTDVIIKSFKARWGSCTIHGVFHYNWHIIMAPEAIIDYLVVHELCHILHHNHSPAFWSAVATYCPNYKDERAWLKLNGPRLSL